MRLTHVALCALVMFGAPSMAVALADPAQKAPEQQPAALATPDPNATIELTFAELNALLENERQAVLSDYVSQRTEPILQKVHQKFFPQPKTAQNVARKPDVVPDPPPPPTHVPQALSTPLPAQSPPPIPSPAPSTN